MIHIHIEFLNIISPYPTIKREKPNTTQRNPTKSPPKKHVYTFLLILYIYLKNMWRKKLDKTPSARANPPFRSPVLLLCGLDDALSHLQTEVERQKHLGQHSDRVACFWVRLGS